MKKSFFFAVAAVLGLAMASCKPELEVSPLKIEVSDITGLGATVTVTCSTDEYFGCGVATPEDLAEYANPYEYWFNELFVTEEDYNENADYYEMFGITSYDQIKEMYLLTKEVSGELELDSETEYVVFAFRLNEDFTLKSAKIDTVHFTTLEGPSEEELLYQLEPTTPITFTLNAAAAQAVAYGNCFNENSVNFSVVLVNAENQGLVLDMNAASGSATLPAGTYNVAVVTSAEAITEGMIIAGNMALLQNYVGSYAVLSDSEFLWVESGSVTVAVDGETYTITGTLTSHYGSTINVSYTGAIEYKQAQQAPKRVAKAIMPLAIKGHVFNRK